MRQAFHIFVKDVRHSWPYVAIVAAILAALVVLDPKTTSADDATSYAVGLLHVALVLAWWLAIAQVVHAETPVGDCQFWVTRPYSWKSLLAAKALFVLLILLPLLAISDCLIVAAFGFQPVAFLPGLFGHLTRMAILMMLPGIIAAALTRGMRQFVSAIAMIVVAYGILFAVASTTHLLVRFPVVDAMLWSQRAPATRWLLEGLSCLPLVLFLGATIWQYSKRRTMPVRLIVLVTYVAWMVCSTVQPSGRTLALEASPDAGRGPFAEVVPVLEPGRRARYEPFPLEKDVLISFPIRIAGRGSDLLEWSPVSEAILPEYGEPWRGGRTADSFSKDPDGDDFLRFRVDRASFKRLSSGPVRVRAVFAIAIYGPESTTRIPFDTAWHPVEGFGLVRFSRKIPVVEMRRPFEEPSVKYVCSVEGGRVPHRNSGSGWYSGALLSPVVDWGGYFQPSVQADEVFGPGAELIFKTEHRLAVVRRDLEIPAVQLSDYVAPN